MSFLTLSSFALLLIFVAGTVSGYDCEVADDSYVQPHIIFLLADDLGFNDIGWNNDTVDSPYLKDLATNGVILNHNYVQPVCSPSRGALQTGKYAFRTAMQHAVIETNTADCLDLTQTLISEEMRDLGYSTHMLGKWHLGFCSWDCTATERGYDTFYGYYNGYVDHINHEIDDWYDWRDQKEVDTGNNGTFATDLIADRAAKLISEDDGSKPMFMVVAMATTHIPIQLPDGTTYQSGDDNERDMFLGMVTAMDKDVETIVEALKDKGYYDNSVIIFSSDNGGEKGGSSNWPLRGSKGSIYEGGTRVAGMVHSPLQTATGKTDDIFSIVDWFPTMIELGGGCADEGAIDGMSQVDMILHGGETRRNEHVYNIDPFYPPNFGRAAVRIDDYKLMWGFPGLYDGWEQDGNLDFSYALDLLDVDDQFVTSGRKKRSEYVLDTNAIGTYANASLDHIYLFNVVEDPEERVNLADDNPDLVESMKARITELIGEAAPWDWKSTIPVPAAKSDEYNGIWTPGWCNL